MLISPAYAQAVGGAPSNDFIVSLMPLVLIFAVFYFLMIRPQQTKMKQHRDMIENLKRGDQVVTGGGILGKVTKVEAGDAMVIVEIAPNVQVRVSRSTISEVVGKPQPATNDNRLRTGGGTTGPVENITARLQRFFKR
jgi:preprotein translocase subunit YajC